MKPSMANPSHSPTLASSEAKSVSTDPFASECIEFFSHVSVALGAQRSIGKIYGLLFASDSPLSLDEITTRLQISKGSASMGLRFLRNLGAIRQRFIVGQRPDYFEPELALRKLVHGYVQQTIQPHLQNGPEWLERLQHAAESDDTSAVARERVKTLKRWQTKSSRLLPLILHAIR